MNKKFTKITAILSVAAVIASLSGCASLAQEETPPEEKGELKFGSDILCGLFLQFTDAQDDPLTTDDFASEQAVKYYYRMTPYDNGQSYYMDFVSGKEVFSQGETHLSVKNGDDYESVSYEYERTVYYTSGLVGGRMYVQGVYYNEDTLVPYAESGRVGYELDDLGKGSASIKQTLSASRTIDGAEKKKTYEASFTINFELIDDLIAVIVYEYDEGGNLLATRAYEKGENYTAGAECRYVVVEERYEVTADYEHNAVKYKGMKYSERSIINRPLGSTNEGIMLHYPTDEGFVEDDYLIVNFAKNA